MSHCVTKPGNTPGNDINLTTAGGELLIAIADGGPGLPESELERMFGPFYRMESSRNRDTGGVGLGLAIIRQIARSHGGAVSLENRGGGGLRAVSPLPLVT